MKTLVIIDPQLDFIIGSLAVPGAETAINNIIAHLYKNSDINDASYDYILVSKDWHKENHPSFKEQGGVWPKHCVEFSIGSYLPNELETTIENYNCKNVFYIHKGEEQEAYSAFETINDTIKNILDDSDKIVVCGLAGDFCVKASVEDLIKSGYKNKIELFYDGIASINPDNCVVL